MPATSRLRETTLRISVGSVKEFIRFIDSPSNIQSRDMVTLFEEAFEPLLACLGRRWTHWTGQNRLQLENILLPTGMLKEKCTKLRRQPLDNCQRMNCPNQNINNHNATHFRLVFQRSVAFADHERVFDPPIRRQLLASHDILNANVKEQSTPEADAWRN